MGVLKDLTVRVKAPASLDLRRRVAVLEEEVQECRALNRRLAELTDLVSELLVPLARGDDEELKEILVRYQESL